MANRLTLVVAVIALGVPLGACAPHAQDVPLAVGTCIRESEQGVSAEVPCFMPHTHKVVAIVGPDQQCPGEATLFSQPADPDDGVMTTCFAPDGADR